MPALNPRWSFGLRRLARACRGLQAAKNAKKEFFRRDLPLVTASYRNARLFPGAPSSGDQAGLLSGSALFKRVLGCIGVHPAFRLMKPNTLDSRNRKDLAPGRIRLTCFSIFKERELSIQRLIFYTGSFLLMQGRTF